MPDFSVHQYGTDSSGRIIWMTAFMHDWIEARVANVGFRPTIVQGAFMVRDGGGAANSAGYHDQAGCVDFRTWDLTPDQIDAWVKECRLHAGAAWRRDMTAAHGHMPSHCHVTIGADQPLSAGAHQSWQSYLNDGDGLVDGRPDYEWRPHPLVTTPPPEDDFMPYSTWPDKDKAALAKDIAAAVTDQILTADMNAQEPAGSSDFVGVNLRAALKAIYRNVVPKPAKH